METRETLQQTYPPLIKRLQSAFIDGLFIIFCMVFLSKFFSNDSEESTGYLRGALLFSLFFIYEPFCMAFACTLGNLVMGIRVRRFDDESKHINIFNSYLRFIVKVFLGIISFFTINVDKYKRAIHDLAANSIMIYEKK